MSMSILLIPEQVWGVLASKNLSKSMIFSSKSMVFLAKTWFSLSELPYSKFQQPPCLLQDLIRDDDYMTVMHEAPVWM